MYGKREAEAEADPSWSTTLVLAMWLMFLLSIMWLESMLIPITTITSCTASVRLRLNLGRPCTDPPWSWPCYPPCPPCPHCPCWCQPCRWSLPPCPRQCLQPPHGPCCPHWSPPCWSRTCCWSPPCPCCPWNLQRNLQHLPSHLLGLSAWSLTDTSYQE